MPFVIGDNAKR